MQDLRNDALYRASLRKSCNAFGAASLGLLSLEVVIGSVIAWNVGEPGQSIIARVAVGFVVLKNFLLNSGRCKKKMRLCGAV
jgi:hypothetical protein